MAWVVTPHIVSRTVGERHDEDPLAVLGGKRFCFDEPGDGAREFHHLDRNWQVLGHDAFPQSCAQEADYASHDARLPFHFESGKRLELGTFARTRRRTVSSAGGRRGPCLWSLHHFASPRTAEGRATSFQRTTLVGSARRVLKQISQCRNSARYCRTCTAVRGDGCGYRQPFIEPRTLIRGLERQTRTPTCRSRRGPERPVSLVIAPFRVAENRRGSADEF